MNSTRGRIAASLATCVATVLAVAVSGCTMQPDPTPTPSVTADAVETVAEPLAVARVTAAPAPTGASAPVEPSITVSLLPTTTDSTGPGVVETKGSSKVVGDGSPDSCTSAAVQRAIKGGGNISFNCGSAKVTILVTSTLYVCNTTTCKHQWQGGKAVGAMTLDGGGKVTLSGGGARGIFYANTCEEKFGWITDHCQDQATPHLTFKNIGFENGNATKGPAGFEGVGGGGGGGAIAVRGAKVTISGAWFTGNQCMKNASDAGGGAVRVTGATSELTITGSSFTNNHCANGGAVSSLHTAMTITGSTFSGNAATGSGASSGNGGNGGAVYYDGAGGESVKISKCTIKKNTAHEGGSGVFFVSNDGSGSLTISGTTMTGNTGQSFNTAPYTSIFFKGKVLTVSGGNVT